MLADSFEFDTTVNTFYHAKFTKHIKHVIKHILY